MNNLSVEHMPRILGVFAHPDDESYCAWGTFAKYIASGAEVMVVSAMRGEAGQIRSPHVAMRRTLGAVPVQDLPSMQATWYTADRRRHAATADSAGTNGPGILCAHPSRF